MFTTGEYYGLPNYIIAHDLNDEIYFLYMYYIYLDYLLNFSFYHLFAEIR